MSQNPEAPAASTVLVVDDNEANRSLAQNTLEDEGYRVVLAGGGAQAIVAFERERPDCVLLDVRMPEVDGFVVCERIRSLPHGADVPIVFLTALRDLDTFDRALEAGGDDFLTKPVRPSELVFRVQAALKLRRVRAELAGYYDLLKRQRDDLMRLQLQKERLMAFVVHDLKNPVNSVDLHAQLLLRERGLSPDARESATQIRAETRQLNRMILNLLDLSKADEGKLSPTRTVIELRTLVDQLLHEFEINAQARKVTLQASIKSRSLRADDDLLRRTLANLIENALRHAPSGSTVAVSAVPRDHDIEIRVADAGSGIPLEMRERIFEAFVQIGQEGRTHARGGRGLGLTFCKLAVEAHGGRIWIEDAAPGAVFCVRLPNEP